MNIKYPCHLWKPLKLLLILLNMIKDESVVIKQEWFDDIKWFVCLLKLSCWSLSPKVEKKNSFEIFKNVLFLTWKFENSLIILQTCVEVAFVPH
jgi:hypothetical protein